MHVRWFSRRISEPSTVSTGVRRISEPVTAMVSAAIGGLWKLLEPRRFQENLIGFLRVPGCPRGGVNWETLFGFCLGRLGNLGNIRED